MLVAALLAVLGSAAAAQPVRSLSGDDLFSLQLASDPQVRPGGASVAYVRQSGDVMTDRMARSIWSVDVASGAQRPLVAGPASIAAALVAGRVADCLRFDRRRRARPALCPLDRDGRAGPGRLACRKRPRPRLGAGRLPACLHYVRSRSGAAPGHVAAPSRRARPGPSRSACSTASFPAPIQAACSARATASSSSFRPTAARHGNSPSGLIFTPARSLSPPTVDASLQWQPKRKAARRSARSRNLPRADVAGGSPVALTRRAGPDVQPTSSPDGRQIAFLGYDGAEAVTATFAST